MNSYQPRDGAAGTAEVSKGNDALGRPPALSFFRRVMRQPDYSVSPTMTMPFSIRMGSTQL